MLAAWGAPRARQSFLTTLPCGKSTRPRKACGSPRPIFRQHVLSQHVAKATSVQVEARIKLVQAQDIHDFATKSLLTAETNQGATVAQAGLIVPKVQATGARANLTAALKRV